MLLDQLADDGKLVQEVRVVGRPLQSFSQVAAGPMRCMVSAFSPVITGGDIVHLAAVGNVSKAVFPVEFPEFFFGENSHFAQHASAQSDVQQHHYGETNHAAHCC